MMKSRGRQAPRWAVVALVVAVPVVADCAGARKPVDYGNGYFIRYERDRSELFGNGYRSVLLFREHFVTDQRFELSPSTRYAFYTAHGNWYVFDSRTSTPRFLRKAPFACSVKFYENAQPPVVRCFDVFNDRMVEMRLD